MFPQASPVCSVLEAGKGDLQAQLDDIEQARILPLQAIIDGLQQDVRGRDDALIEQQSRIAELQGQAEEAQERLETKRSKKQAYKQAFSGKVRATNSTAVGGAR